MYGKRGAWALFGVAPPPRGGYHPTLADIAVALQAELPTARAALADVLWAARGEGVQAETHDLRTGAVTPFVPRPSRASTLAGGFAAISKFFPGAKAAAAELEESLFLEVLGPPTSASPQVFDDEYISSGGQLYELMVGHDRFIADLRPLFLAATEPAEETDSPQRAGYGLCAHPYDLCTELIAREVGVIVTDERGQRLRAPLDIRADCAWIGYANRQLQEQIEPLLQRILKEIRV
jgi:hypothetical protein